MWAWSSWSDVGDYLIGETGGYNGGVVNFWVRPPSGVVDTQYPEVFRWPQDTTLVKLEASFNYRAGPVPPAGTGAFCNTFWMGIIEWPGVSDVPPNDFIDPSDGGLGWIWRNYTTSTYQTVQFASGGDFLEAFQSKTKRKLDNAVGLLGVAAVTSTQPALIGTVLEDVAWELQVRWLELLP